MLNRKDRRREATRLRQEHRRESRRCKGEPSAGFPEFEFDEAEGNLEFITLVKEAIQKFDFHELSEFDQRAFRRMKQKGMLHALKALTQEMAEIRKSHPDDPYGQLGDSFWVLSLGETIFKKIPETDLERFLPMNDVEFLLDNKRIIVQFASLPKQSSSWGSLYYSRYKPTIEIDGQRYVVGFSKEAIDKACERITPGWKTYAGLGDMYSYFEECRYFELCTLRDGHPAFSFFAPCGDEQFWRYQYVTEVLGRENIDPAMPYRYYRVGYCPVVIEGKFAKAKTVLFPGFSQTPEYGALNRANLPFEEKRRLKQIATNGQTVSQLFETSDFSALKWFHNNGVPQVVQRTEPLYEYVRLKRWATSLGAPSA